MADTNPNTKTPAGNTPNTDAAIEALLADETVSSQNSNLEELLSGNKSSLASGIKASKASTEANKASIEGSFGRAIEDTTATGVNNLTGATESSRGFAINIGVISTITKDTERRVTDLEQRKQELLLQNNATGAQQISQLQFQALQFEQDAKQKAFTNLLGLAGLGLQVKESKRGDAALALQERNQNFAERSAINSIALQFGVVPNENDTLESITARVAPFASERQKLDIAKARAEIARANAETQKALQGQDFVLDADTTASLASTVNSLYAEGKNEEAAMVLGALKDNKGINGYNKVKIEAKRQVAETYSSSNVGTQAGKAAAQGIPKSDFLPFYENLRDTKVITSDQFSAISSAIDSAYTSFEKKTPYSESGSVSANLGRAARALFNPKTYFGE